MKILIIDDEQLIRQGVYDQLLEMKLPVDEILIASGADQAREILEHKKIQIFLCDIVMPQEDGITFAKWVLKQYPDSKFIFLTAHSDYAYMKEAISIQSFDYLLQPVAKEELFQVVNRAIMQVTLEAKNKKLFQCRKLLIDNEIDILEGNSLRYLQGLTENKKYLTSLIEQRTRTLEEDTLFCVVYVQVLKTKSVWKEKDKDILREIYYNIFEEVMGELDIRPIILLRSDLSGSVFVLLRFCEGNKRELPVIADYLNNFRVLYNKVTGTELAIYYTSYCDISMIRGQTKNLLKEVYENVTHVGSVFFVGDKGEKVAEYSFDIQFNSWRMLVNRDRLEEFRQSLFAYLDYHVMKKDVDRNFLMKLHSRISELILRKVAEEKISTNDIFDQNYSYYDFMYSFDDTEKFKEMISKVLEKIRRLMGREEQNPVERVVSYIRENIEKDISVGVLADLIGVTPEYLSRVFKKVKGVSLKKYIINEKIEAAKILLTTTTLPVTLIAENVGYGNYSNFTYTFHQIVGYTPTEYRQKQESMGAAYKTWGALIYYVQKIELKWSDF